MWLAMEPTHPNEHQKTLHETINLKGERMLELSYFTSQKVYKANLGSWNINHQCSILQRGQSPLLLYLTVVSTQFLLFIFIFIHGQYFHNVNASPQNNLWIDHSKEKGQSPPKYSESTRLVFTLENIAAKLLVQLVKTHLCTHIPE